MLDTLEDIFPIREIVSDGNFGSLSYNNRLLYENWVGKLQKGRTWFGFQFNWPRTWTRTTANNIPSNFGTYVFSWHLESWPYDWINEFCQTHPDQQIVVIGEFDGLPPRINLKILKHHCWHLVVPWALAQYNCEFQSQKQYVLSSLSAKQSYYKALVTAFLNKNFSNRTDIVWSWNIFKLDLLNNPPDQCGSMNLLDQQVNNAIIDDLAEYTKNNLLNLSKDLGGYPRSINQSWNFDHYAYTDCLVNVTNETFVNDVVGNTRAQGPYFSEKTWKPLLGGSAVLPLGMSGTYDHLAKFGFAIDYPWSKEFDLDCFGSNDRLVKLLDVLDYVIENHAIISGQVNDMNRFNYDYIRSDKFVSTIKQLNHEYLEQFLASY